MAIAHRIGRCVSFALIAVTSLVMGCDSVCGDGVVGGAEQCDDGNSEDNDHCSSSCTWSSCAEGFPHPGADPCPGTPVCGNGAVEAGEACDDGNRINTDGCPNICALKSCGCGIPFAGTACDDGNLRNDDSCSNRCMPAGCGDGWVWAGVEGCDDANRIDTDECRNDCSLPTCGDGVVQAGELCDDGNDVLTDECARCQLPSCGDGVVQAGVEECDDGNTYDRDECRNDCVAARCGDGVRRSAWYAGEEPCDDGNTENADFCDATCQLRCEAADWEGFTAARMVDGWCYLLSPTPRSAPDAADECERLAPRARLIADRDEIASELARAAGVSDVWIGVGDAEEEGDYRPAGFSRSIRVAYWAVNEPDDRGEGGDSADCVAAAAEPPSPRYGSWSDEPCETERAFVCSVRLAEEW